MGAIAILVIVVLIGVRFARHEGSDSLNADFQGPDGLVTNEYTHWNPNSADAHRSPVWDVTSGSLFRRDGVGWSGTPDVSSRVDAGSDAGTNSAVFRATTIAQGHGDVVVSLRLRVIRFTDDEPPSDWDGVNLWVRHRSPQWLYAFGVARRDQHVAIKRKVPGGPSNGGTYTTLADTAHPWEPSSWHEVSVSTCTAESGDTALSLSVDGRQLLTATDPAATAVPGPGAIGIRADNTEFEFADVRVLSCPSK